MAFISYAQNYEDVMLWRALRDIDKGFYVDVGAADPEFDSVTRAFYERGWSGINVEPLEEHFARLVQARPRDTNLNVAAGREDGPATLYAFRGTGLSTLDPQISARHQAAGWLAEPRVVPVRRLGDVLRQCAPPAIHFLNIDVEGAEAEVLAGLDLGRVRPWVLVIEATEPNTTQNSRPRWEHLVTAQRYSLAYFDGLNCFYVADEVGWLKQRLAAPPHYFDDFLRWPEWVSRQRASALEQALVEAHGQLQGLEAALQAEQAHAAVLQETLHAYQAQSAPLLVRARQAADALSACAFGVAVRRGFHTLRQTGDRLTGGGARALARWLWAGTLRRVRAGLMPRPPAAPGAQHQADIVARTQPHRMTPDASASTNVAPATNVLSAGRTQVDGASAPLTADSFHSLAAVQEGSTGSHLKISDKIFFLHNPKAGGSALRRMLESHFPTAKRCPIIENSKVEHDSLSGDYARFRGYDLYMGHYGRDIFDAVNDGHACMTNFRHPAARLVSIYNYFRYVVSLPEDELRTDRFYAVRLAKSVSFEKFVCTDDPRVEVYVRNAHFRQLANTCWSLKIAKQFTDVSRFVDAMACYYVCEYPEMSVRWMRRVLNWDLDRLPRENVTGEHGGQAISFFTLDERTYRIICKKNDLDLAIYRYAVDRLLNSTYPTDDPSGWRLMFKSGMRNAVQTFRRSRRTNCC